MGNLKHFVFCLMLGALCLVGGCASYSGAGLKPGQSDLGEIITVMGEPAMRWKEADGSEQLAYPRGPAGTQTFMVFVGENGRLARIEGVLETAYFAKIIPGESDIHAVLKLLGPPPQHWITYFEARDELVWEWRICDSWNQMAFFDVLFDNKTGIVRSTMQRPDLSGFDGMPIFCGH